MPHSSLGVRRPHLMDLIPAGALKSLCQRVAPITSELPRVNHPISLNTLKPFFYQLQKSFLDLPRKAHNASVHVAWASSRRVSVRPFSLRIPARRARHVLRGRCSASMRVRNLSSPIVRSRSTSAPLNDVIYRRDWRLCGIGEWADAKGEVMANEAKPSTLRRRVLFPMRHWLSNNRRFASQVYGMRRSSSRTTPS